MYLNFTDPHLTEEKKHAAFLASCDEYGLVHHLDLREAVQLRLGL